MSKETEKLGCLHSSPIVSEKFKNLCIWLSPKTVATSPAIRNLTSDFYFLQ